MINLKTTLRDGGGWIKDNTLYYDYGGAIKTYELSSNYQARLFAEQLITVGKIKYVRDNGRLCWFSGHDPNDPYAMLSTW